MQAISRGEIFEMKPETLNRIEVRAVARQENHVEAMGKGVQRSPCRPALVVGRIVQDQDQLVGRIAGEQQVFEEGNEGVGVFVGGDEMAHLSGLPVERRKDMAVSRCAGSGNAFTLTAFHPAAPQGRVQAQGRFVHKEELEGFVSGFDGVFFNQSSSSLAAAWAS